MNKILTFFGGDSQVGTTMIAQSVAELLAKKDKKVLLILGSGEYGTDYINCKTEISIDDIRVNLSNNQILEEDVNEIIFEYNKISVLPGIKNITTLKYYGIDYLETLIKVLSKNYQYIIVDAGNNIQYGLSVSALKYGEERYYILTQQEKSIRRFKNLMQSVLDLMEYNGKIIINKFNNNIAFYSQKQIEEIFQVKDSYIINYIEYGWQAESDRDTLLKYPKFAEGIKIIVQDILCENPQAIIKKPLFKRYG